MKLVWKKTKSGGALIGINKKSCIAYSVLEPDKQQKTNEPDKIAVLKLLVRLVFVIFKFHSEGLF